MSQVPTTLTPARKAEDHCLARLREKKSRGPTLSLRDTQPMEGTRPNPESPILSATPQVSCSSSLKVGVSFLVLLLTSPTVSCSGG